MIVSPLFQFHKLNQTGVERAKLIAEAYDGLLQTIRIIVPENSRELALALTKLEESCFFAKKAMAQLAENQDQ